MVDSEKDFPAVAPAPDPAAGLHSLDIVPVRWFLREGFFNDPAVAWPEGLKGTHFADPALVECTTREVIVPPFDKHEDIGQHVTELSKSIKLVLDADHDYSATFQPTGNKDFPVPGPAMAAHLVGLYAEKTDGSRDAKTGKLKITGDLFIPLSAIIKDPQIYCDRTKFPRFFDHSPNIANLKAGLAKGVARGVDKEADFGVGFKTYIGELRALSFKFAAILLGLHSFLTLLYGITLATIVVLPIGYGLKSAWHSSQKKLKHLWTVQYPVYREYWRFKKDDEIARQFNYNFPFFASHPLLRSVRARLGSISGSIVPPICCVADSQRPLLLCSLQMLGGFFKTGNENKMKSNFLPPDVTHENKAVSGNKAGDQRVQVRYEAHS